MDVRAFHDASAERFFRYWKKKKKLKFRSMRARFVQCLASLGKMTINGTD